MSFHAPEKYRVLDGLLKSVSVDGNNGAFVIPPKIANRQLAVIISDGLGWEHVSVHCFIGKKNLTPCWEEMCYVKSLFWDVEDVVMELHPAKSEYVNCHPHTLHLWRPIELSIPTPPKILVG